MSHNENVRAKYLYPLMLSLLLLQVLVVSPAGAADESVDEQETPGLSDAEVASLQDTLSELKLLAPKLRVLLRTLRRQVGFDPREIHNIERGMGQSEKDLERMIAMHQRGAFNQMRAHFMADDLRRKAEGLKESLAYVKQRIRELDEAPGGRQADPELKKNDDALVELLGLYTDLVSQSVMLLKDKGL